jgi:alanine dehydrogenase
LPAYDGLRRGIRKLVGRGVASKDYTSEDTPGVGAGVFEGCEPGVPAAKVTVAGRVMPAGMDAAVSLLAMGADRGASLSTMASCRVCTSGSTPSMGSSAIVKCTSPTLVTLLRSSVERQGGTEESD